VGAFRESVRLKGASVAVRIVPRGPGEVVNPFQSHQNIQSSPEKVMPSIATLNYRCGGKRLLRLLSLFLALAVTSPMLLAQEWDHWDHLNGRDKVHDPTGVWFLRTPIDALKREFLLVVFHKGGTLTGDGQGASGFDPSSVPLPKSDPKSVNTVIGTPFSGVWQKTGWNTFAGMFQDMEYFNLFNPASGLPPDVSVFHFAKIQITGTLSQSGDAMTFNGFVTHYDPQGKKKGDPEPFNGAGTRIPLEILPNISDTLPLPPPQ
jgi:hypothetical protein